MNELANHAQAEHANISFIPPFDEVVSHHGDAATAYSCVAPVRTMRGRTAAFVLCLVAPFLGLLCPAAHAPGNPSAIAYSFGTVGVADPANYPPGHYYAATWTDSSGKFWMFGGSSPLSNDLWQFDPSTGLWTCMSGPWVSGALQPGSYGTLDVPAASNLPPARLGAASWIDSSGKLWLFGGNSSTANGWEYNDLWVFDPSTTYWTWKGGGQTYRQQGVYGTLGTPNANNFPSSRQRPAIWTDSSGNVWLYGGYGQGYTAAGAATQGYLNDLWKLDMTALQWTWMGGSDVVNKPGTFGTQGVAAASNIPGALAFSAYWTDSSGNFWLFGGSGYAKTTSGGYLDDVWTYSPSTGQWTWLWGDGTVGKTTVYGVVGVEAASNHLGGRTYSSGWGDGAGNFWLFGGYGYGATTSAAPRDDIWRFNPSTGNWTWMAGTTAANSSPVYDTQGVANATNDPGARGDVATWVDNSGNLWMFGGNSTPTAPTTGRTYTDLWKYQFSATADQPVFNPTGATYQFDQTVTISDSTPEAVIYYTTDGTTPTIHSTVYTGPIAVNTPETIQAIAAASGYSYSPAASATYAFNRPPAATPVIVPGSGSYSTAQSVTIADTTPKATIYYTTDGSTPTTSSPVYAGPITVDPPATVKAIAVADEYTTSAVATATYTHPVVATPVISPVSGSYPDPLSISITDTTPGATIYYTTDGTTPTTSSSVYNGPISISFSATIQAFAVEGGYTTSDTAKAVYTVIQPTPGINDVSPITFTPNSAFTATVNGSNFVSTSVVYAGPIPLSTQYVSSTQLTAQVPASLTNIDPFKTGGVSITVETPGALSASNGVAITAISANHASMPITITPATATVTAGSSVNFSVSVGNGTSLSYGAEFVNLPAGTTGTWTPDPNVTNSGTATLTLPVATPKGTYTILVVCFGTVPTTNPAGMLLPIFLLPLLSLRKRWAAKRIWLTLSAALILLVSALSLGGCATGPRYQFTTTSTNNVVNATQITLTVQ
jgi:hypothetical protein